MLRKMLFSKTNVFMIFVLYFCIPFSLMFYQCLTNETNYNLKLDRGLVSSSAVYFSFAKLLSEGDISTDGSSLDSSSLRDAIRVIDAESYFLVSQLEDARAVCYQKDMDLPPIREGRFFSSEECWNNAKLAVIGKNHLDETWIQPDSSKRMISLSCGDYEVVGVMGTGKISTIDDLVFVNIGSLDESMLMTRIFYLDSQGSHASKLFRKLSSEISSTSSFSTTQIEMPATAADIVSGGVFFSDILKYTIYAFLMVTYICMLVFFIVSSQERLAICTLIGQSFSQSLLRVFMPILLCGLAGIAVAVISTLLMIHFSFFELPDYMVYSSMVKSSLTGLLALLLFPVVQRIAMRSINLSENLR